MVLPRPYREDRVTPVVHRGKSSWLAERVYVRLTWSILPSSIETRYVVFPTERTCSVLSREIAVLTTPSATSSPSLSGHMLPLPTSFRFKNVPLLEKPQVQEYHRVNHCRDADRKQQCRKLADGQWYPRISRTLPSTSLKDTVCYALCAEKQRIGETRKSERARERRRERERQSPILPAHYFEIGRRPSCSDIFIYRVRSPVHHSNATTVCCVLRTERERERERGNGPMSHT